MQNRKPESCKGERAKPEMDGYTEGGGGLGRHAAERETENGLLLHKMDCRFLL